MPDNKFIFAANALYSQIKPMAQGRDYFNKSSIDFSKFSQSVPDPQQNRIYTYQTEISSTLKDKTTDFNRIQTKFYRNKIFHSANKYQVPVYDYGKNTHQPNSPYQEFYRTHRKFIKPYGEHTKYVDNLNKNKQLLRRCNFDIPVTLEIQTAIKNSKYNSNICRRTISRYEKQEPATAASPKNTDFNKTIHNQYLIFRKMLDKERNLGSDKVELNNSMNRILAAEMINLRIGSAIGKGRSRTIEA